MKRFAYLAGLAFALAGCAQNAAVLPEQVPVTVHSRKKLQIRWVNEIGTSTDSLYKRGGLAAIGEALMGKEPVRLDRPYAVHVDHRDRIFVTDPDSHRVHLFDVSAKQYRVILSPNRQELISPLSLASDEDDNLYITDSASGKLYRYRVTEQRLERFSRLQFQRPTGIAFDPYLQRMFVVDTLAHQVVVLDPAGEELYRIGKRGERPGEFNYPTDICIDKWGRLLVNDTLNSRIQIFAPDGSFLFCFGTPGSAPGSFLRAKGIAADNTGTIYVSDALTDMIQIFDFKGRHVAAFGKSGGKPGEFWLPLGLFIDREERLYVVDVYNNRIQMFEGLVVDPMETRSQGQ